jgi:hypothetical protein
MIAPANSRSHRHERRRTHRHQSVGTQAGGALTYLALETNEAA